jgi:hypothetical protein
MTLDRQHGRLIMCCDTCGETREGDQGEFDAFIEGTKRDGWKMRKIGAGREGHDWVHACPDCDLSH